MTEQASVAPIDRAENKISLPTCRRGRHKMRTMRNMCYHQDGVWHMLEKCSKCPTTLMSRIGWDKTNPDNVVPIATQFLLEAGEPGTLDNRLFPTRCYIRKTKTNKKVEMPTEAEVNAEPVAVDQGQA